MATNSLLLRQPKATPWPSIVRLFFWSGPSAILRRVVAISVNAIYGVRWRGLLAHIFQEILKRLPTLTNRDSLGSVVRPTNVLGIATTALHLAPSTILTAIRFPTEGCPKTLHGGIIVSPSTSLLKATARHSVPSPQPGPTHRDHPSAIAETQPKRVNVTLMSPFNFRHSTQASELHSGGNDREKLRHQER
jgi:hypothetical protein